MKTLPPTLAAHLAGAVTTLATCWLVTRTDGETRGFTDHDRPLAVDSVTCRPENGLTLSAMSDGPGFAAGGGDVEGRLDGPALSPDDLAAGLWDNAAVKVYRVNWAEPGQAVLLRRAIIGEVTRTGQAFRAELRGLSHLLEARRGRVFQKTCDADLGDARCGVDLSGSNFTGTASVIAADRPDSLEVSGLEGFAAGWFTRGRCHVLDGPHAGFASEVAEHRVTASRIFLHLWQAAPALLAAGTALTVTAGCDKHLATCRDKFSNTANFRGFPHMPGTDFVLSYPTRNTGENDGGPLVG
ncbi:MAG: DUF2163 domain-containing protein [Roseibium sp.]|nr:DUF2163 domain-containing protein [Roseibium sp.]